MEDKEREKTIIATQEALLEKGNISLAVKPCDVSVEELKRIQEVSNQITRLDQMTIPQ